MATPVTPVKSIHNSQHQSTTTPHANRNLVHSTQQNQGLASSREQVIADTAEVDVIPSGELIDAILGKLDGIDAIRRKLVHNGSLSDSGWTALYTPAKESYLPCDSPLEEDKAFAGLATIFEQCLLAAGISRDTCNVQLKVHGHANMATNFPNKTKPDATIHLTNSSLLWARDHTIDHADVYLYVELKKTTAEGNFQDVSIEYFVMLTTDHDPT
jgi:hypothetical protein